MKKDLSVILMTIVLNGETVAENKEMPVSAFEGKTSHVLGLLNMNTNSTITIDDGKTVITYKFKTR